MVEYGRQYLVQDYCEVVWWKIFNCVDSSKWSNILAVVELSFCLPAANGYVERAFSHREDQQLHETQQKYSRSPAACQPGRDPSSQLGCFCCHAALVERKRKVNRKEHHSTTAVPELQCNEPEPEPEPEPFEFDWEERKEWIDQDRLVTRLTSDIEHKTVLAFSYLFTHFYM